MQNPAWSQIGVWLDLNFITPNDLFFSSSVGGRVRDRISWITSFYWFGKPLFGPFGGREMPESLMIGGKILMWWWRNQVCILVLGDV